MNSSYVVGIDVGGQTTKLGVVDARGTVLAQTVIRTDTYDKVEPYIAELSEAVKEDDAAKVVEIANEVVIMVGDRNKKCKLLK